jgi:hypothetical protein
MKEEANTEHHGSNMQVMQTPLCYFLGDINGY